MRIARQTIRPGRVSRAETLRYLGYQGQELGQELDERIEDVTERCLALANPRGSLAGFAVSHQAGMPVLEGCSLRLAGDDIAEHLATANEVVLFAVTLGIGIDQELRRLALTDPFGQVLFDAVATALVERAADAVEAHIRAYAAESDRYTSWRFSPGYGDLPLSVQGDLLASLDAGRQLGITLTPSDLMIPTKSVTALVGIHPTPQPGLASSCAICSLSDFCTLRHTGRTCHG